MRLKTLAIVTMSLASVSAGQPDLIGPPLPEAPARPLVRQSEPQTTTQTPPRPMPEASLTPRAGELAFSGVREAAKPPQESRPIAPPSVTNKSSTEPIAKAAPAEGGVSMTRMIVSLSAVLALIVLVAGIVKKVSRSSGSLAASIGAGGRAPSGVLQVLGRYPVGGGCTIVLLKVDRRVLVVSQTRVPGLTRIGGGAMQWTTLSEITDPAEVASLVGKTIESERTNPSACFEAAMEQAQTQEPPRQAQPTPVRRALETIAGLTPARRAVAESPRPAAPQADVDPVVALRRRLAEMRARELSKQAVGSRAEVLA
jgi:flagellar biogenesis protein FliO